MFGTFSYLSGVAMYYITPMTLTVISGVLSAFAGVVWFARHSGDQFTLGMRSSENMRVDDQEAEQIAAMP